MLNFVSGWIAVASGLTLAVLGLTLIYPPFGVWLYGLWP